MDDGLKIEVTDEDAELLTAVAKRQYRNPAQQAAAFVHDALTTLRANPQADDAPVAVPAQPRTVGKRGPQRDKAA